MAQTEYYRIQKNREKKRKKTQWFLIKGLKGLKGQKGVTSNSINGINKTESDIWSDPGLHAKKTMPDLQLNPLKFCLIKYNWDFNVYNFKSDLHISAVGNHGGIIWIKYFWT